MIETTSTKTAIILGATIILSSVIMGTFYYRAQVAHDRDTLSVTGSAKKTVTSDRAKIILSITRTVSIGSLASANTAIAHDVSILKTLLKNKAVAEEDIDVSPVFMDQTYDQNQNAEIRYNLHQSVTIQSEDVAKITDISKAVPTLIAQGAIISIQSLEYYYSKLPDLRVTLLAESVKDALARANSIAKSTGRAVGEIRGATSGVVQVIPVNSVEVSDYGSYDTSSVDRDVMVTVKASFGLK